MALQRCVVTVITIALVLGSQPVEGQFSVSASVGLDPQTRNLIEKLPEETKKQILDLVNQLLPTFKTNFDAALKEVNDDVSAQLKAGQCSITAIEKEASDQARATVGAPSDPMQLFRAKVNNRVAELNSSSNPQAFVDVYVDLAHKATVLSCQIKNDPGVGKDVAFDEETKYARLGYVWFRIHDQCKDPNDCATKLRNATDFFIQHSDPRDVHLVRATETLANTPHPPMPTSSWGKPSVQVAPYETVIDQLIKVQDEVTLAKQLRELSASSLIAGANADEATGENELAAARASLVPTPGLFKFCMEEVKQSSVDTANAHLASANSAVTSSESKLAQAQTDDASQTQNVQGLVSKLSTLKQTIGSVQSTAKPVAMHQFRDCGLH